MKLILLDRDGVINEDSPNYIKSPKEWKPIPGSLQAIAQLNQAGYIVVVITNQSGIGRGLYDFTDLTAIHDKMKRALHNHQGRIDQILICPHHPQENCVCRKPKPTLLLQAMAQYKANPQDTAYVGDKWSDIQAAQRAGCIAVLVKTGQGLLTLNHHPQITIYNNLAHYVQERLSHA